MTIPRSSWRNALSRVRISESSELPAVSLAALLAAGGERVAALEAYREVLEASPGDLGALVGLGAVLARLGREEEEIAIRRRIVTIQVAGTGLAPEHRSAAIAFELAAMGIGVAPPEMPSAYATALFDGYAARFDVSLRGDLHYQGPELLQRSLLRAMSTIAQPSVTLDICDVGCGTGLLGPLLRPMARRLDGVDCSPRMLDQARSFGFYDDLVEADLTAVLTGRPGAYDVVTACDVLVYIGDLAPVLGAMATAVRPGGLAAFTVEQSEEEGYRLGASGRYQHAPAYVREAVAASGWVEVSVEQVTLRREQGSAVTGLVWVLAGAGPRATA